VDRNHTTISSTTSDYNLLWNLYLYYNTWGAGLGFDLEFGFWVGRREGSRVGLRVGLTIEGSRVGLTVCLRWEGSRVVFDNLVGMWDGSRVGLRAVGPEDGKAVGSDDGSIVGPICISTILFPDDRLYKINKI